MKILLLAHEFPPFFGGVGRYANELAAAAAASGHRVDVLAPSFGGDVKTFEDGNLTVRRFAGVRYSSKNFHRMIFNTAKATIGKRYDIIHATDYAFALGLSLVGRFARGKQVATVHGGDVLNFPASKAARFLRLRKLYNHFDLVVTNSEYTKRLLMEICPRVEETRIRAVPLGVSAWWLEEPQAVRVKSLRDKFAVQPSDLVVITVSRLESRKGHLGTIAALGRLPQDVKKRVFYIIVGKEDEFGYAEKIEQAFAQAQIRGVLTGGIEQDDIRALFRLSHVFCMPGLPHKTKVEGFGLAYLEAAAQGLPSIASNLGGAPEAVADGETGFVVNPGEEAALSAALYKILSDGNLQETFRQNCLNRASTYNWTRCAEATYVFN